MTEKKKESRLFSIVLYTIFKYNVIQVHYYKTLLNVNNIIIRTKLPRYYTFQYSIVLQ